MYNNNFLETIPPKILASLFIIDDMILKFFDDDFENIFDNFHDLRDNDLYMLSFQKVVKEAIDKARNSFILILY